MVRKCVCQGTRQKCHHPRQYKIFNGYDYFNTYVSVGSLRDTTDYGRSGVQRHVITSEASRVVSIISHNNKNTTVLSTLFNPYLREY